MGLDEYCNSWQVYVTLAIEINEETGDCSVLLHCIGSEILRAIYLGSPGARVVRDMRGQLIEVGAPESISGSHDSLQPFAHGLRVYTNPCLRIELFGTSEAV